MKEQINEVNIASALTGSLSGRTDISSTDYSQTMINHAIKLLPGSSKTKIREIDSVKKDDKAFTLGFKR